MRLQYEEFLDWLADKNLTVELIDPLGQWLKQRGEVDELPMWVTEFKRRISGKVTVAEALQELDHSIRSVIDTQIGAKVLSAN
jgi:hypothetical protein